MRQRITFEPGRRAAPQPVSIAEHGQRGAGLHRLADPERQHRQIAPGVESDQHDVPAAAQVLDLALDRPGLVEQGRWPERHGQTLSDALEQPEGFVREPRRGKHAATRGQQLNCPAQGV